LRTIRLLVLVPVAVCALAWSGSASAAARCPTQTFLAFDHLAYEASQLPTSAGIQPGARLGTGTVDAPADPTGCKRQQSSLPVLRAATIDPRVAVVVQGRRSQIFVVGARCAGFQGDARWACLLHPLVFAGTRYTATRYPASPAPQGRLSLGRRLGTANLDGRPVTVVAIDGVEPSLAVGIVGRPSEAFVAPSVCPYEGFANTAVQDDLLRCLEGPVWFTFDPPGGQVGSRVVARSDRPIGSAVGGATISLVPLPVVADLVPKKRSGAVRIGAVRPDLTLTIPDVTAGLYEAVVSCHRCAATHGGKTRFPAGSILVAAKSKGSRSVQIVTYALLAAVIAAAIASVAVFRRNRRRRLSGSESERS
jgi:hypothetical protein